jgi:hypothetical protein
VILSLLALLISMNADGQMGVWLRILPLSFGALYIAASIAAAFHVSVRERSVETLLMPLVFLVLHLSYGAGTLTAIVSNARPPSAQLTQVREAAEPS